MAIRKTTDDKVAHQKDESHENANREYQSRKGVNRKAKASVFEDLFSDRENLFKLYRVLHPEDKETKPSDLSYITLKNVLTTGVYNDLGFMVGNRLIILAEAQSTWSVNIIIRLIIYLVETWARFFKENKYDLFAAEPVPVPVPELYIIYTGKQRINKKEISLSKEFFGGRQTAVDVRVKILNYADKKDIVGQYVLFCKIFDEQLRLYPHDRMKAVEETVKICINEDVLREYLEDRKKEVGNIMYSILDQEVATEMMLASERRKSKEEGLREGHRKGRREGLKEGRSKGRTEGQIQQTVELYREFGKSEGDTVSALYEKFGLTESEARSTVKKYWK